MLDSTLCIACLFTEGLLTEFSVGHVSEIRLWGVNVTMAPHVWLKYWGSKFLNNGYMSDDLLYKFPGPPSEAAIFLVYTVVS